MRKFRDGAAALLATIGLLAASAPPASAYEPVNIVHTERVQAGPYGLTVGFSTWPLKAMQSLDFTFIPDGGIADKSGTFATTNPETGRQGRPNPLTRHPRKLDVWGLDIRALDSQGDWKFRFVIDGPAGRGEGELSKLPVLEQPGPPMALSWSISVLPLAGLIGFLVVAWRRTRTRVAG
ncbi:hypothetical protein [Amycolatopsis magusensis]|uniref:CopC domain-containing protein n=1 Tax=Amycolatopsis magusensis TaxID=882444 RepID=A0ABS4PJ26_9PSEU|nr:hypothetical protein [Amycolatopsis magusensis]MBP2179368.1 hypothetical protein [Amycolatopsis magusensis]MDI5978427.1 hypothetical protein [Amycolatopsis magusensis]